MASDPAAEPGRYLHFGRDLQALVATLKILSTETPEDLEQAFRQRTANLGLRVDARA